MSQKVLVGDYTDWHLKIEFQKMFRRVFCSEDVEGREYYAELYNELRRRGVKPVLKQTGIGYERGAS